MDKKSLIKAIVDICQKEGWPTSEKVKNDEWAADVLIDYKNYKVAINIGKRFFDVDSAYKAMREDRTCGCWLLLPSRQGGCRSEKAPHFYVTEEGEVNINNIGYFFISDFIRLLVSGNITRNSSAKIKYFDIYPFKVECWKCHKEFFVYFVKRIITDDGAIFNYMSDFGNIGLYYDDFIFDDDVVSLVLDYKKSHPEFKLGEIKQRYSKTVEDSYLSFGCPECDSIVGDFYLTDYIMELIYDNDEYCSIRLDAEKLNRNLPIEHWVVQE